MSLTSSLFSLTGILYAAAAFAGVSVAIWFFVRKRQTRIWLPTVRILDIEQKTLPKLVVRPPRWLRFLCFCLTLAALIIFATRPRQQIFTPFDPTQSRVHLFVDLSPSVSAYADIRDVSEILAKQWQFWSQRSRVTFSTSHSAEVHAPSNAEAANRIVKELGFHRAGLRIGAALRQQLPQLSDIDRLMILSDTDLHSWSDFNWGFLAEDMDVRFLNLVAAAAASAKTPVNVFLNAATTDSPPGARVVDWDIEVGRGGPAQDITGTLTASIGDQELARESWLLPAAKEVISVRLSWPRSRLPSPTEAAHILWELQVQGQNAIAVDDTFRTFGINRRTRAAIVAASSGEQSLADPAYQLRTILGVLGLKVSRYDRLPASHKIEQYPFWILLGGGVGGPSSFCLDPGKGYRRGASKAIESKRIWLAPVDNQARFSDLCSCYSRLVLAQSFQESDRVCQHLTTRDDWVGFLDSVGGKRIGGAIGDITEAVAFRSRNRAAKWELLSFTIPLMPSLRNGLTHGSLALLIRALFEEKFAVDEGDRIAAKWPRIENIADANWGQGPDHRQDSRHAHRVGQRMTNVPKGESLLVSQDEKRFPPQWQAQPNYAETQIPAKQDREDPLPWIRLCVVLVLFAAVSEILAYALGLITRMMKSAAATAVLCAAIIGGALPDPASAQIELNVIGYAGQELRFEQLRAQVEHRTSLTLAPLPLRHAQLDISAVAEPWIWVRDLNRLTSRKGHAKQRLVAWLRSGGLLVIEGNYSTIQLERFTESITKSDTREAADGGRWKAIPPDHELMRSFYLLDALPTCQGNFWRGFHFDERLAILAVPYPFMATLADRRGPNPCPKGLDTEQATRVLVNLVMVALATDYKKDQIHLPEILKRLR